MDGERSSTDLVDVLAADRARLDRGSAVERVADVLRQRVVEGLFLPGTRLSEGVLVDALGVSRNTLRESFRLLMHEHLVVHELHRGVFVRVPSAESVTDLYRVRKIVECAALRALPEASEQALAAVRAAVEEGTEAAAHDKWLEVGTADLRFHQAIAALAGSPRVDEMMRGLLAELRLVFHVMANPREFHKPYLSRNREILSLLETGDVGPAERALADYLADAREQLTTAYHARGTASRSRVS